MSKATLFSILSVTTLAGGFIFHILYTNGTLNTDTGSYSAVMMVVIPLFALFTCLTLLSKGKSVAASLGYTIIISAIVLTIGYISIFAIGLSAI
jgi:hypothetical protein